jgi:hypothetical protein
MFGGNVLMFACQFDNNLFALLLSEGICHSNRVKTKVYRYSALRSELVYNKRGSELVRNELTSKVLFLPTLRPMKMPKGASVQTRPLVAIDSAVPLM